MLLKNRGQVSYKDQTAIELPKYKDTSSYLAEPGPRLNMKELNQDTAQFEIHHTKRSH